MYNSSFILLRKHIAAATRKITLISKSSSQSSNSIRRLERKLRRLQEINKSASSLINERRRLIALLRQEESMKARKTKCSNNSEDQSAFSNHDRRSANKCSAEFTSTRESFSTSAMLQHLPQNSALNSAMAFMLHQHRDKRAELEFTRHLITSTLLSLATPVGAWDPYDVKPQVFALDTFIVLPVFTSLEFVELFCAQFGFTVRDPSGVLWVDGQRTHEEWYNNNNNSTKERIHALLEANLITCEEPWEQNKHVEHNVHTATDDQNEILESKQKENVELKTPISDNGNTTNANNVEITMDNNTSPLSETTQTSYTVENANGSAERESQEFQCEQEKTEITPLMLFDLVDPEISSLTSSSSSSSSLQTEHKNKTFTTIEEKHINILKSEQRKKVKRKWKKKIGKQRRCVKSSAKESKHSNNTFTKEHVKPKSSPSSSEKEKEEAKMKEKRRKETVHQMLEHLASIQPFHIKQAQPLPMFGTPIRPYFVGYFADIDTLLQNATIVPTKVDIIVNPCSSLEFVLAREATNKIKNKDQLLSLAYRNLEKELQREFAAFFMAYCPEVKSAKSACIPLPLSVAQVKQMDKQANDAESSFDQSWKYDSNPYEYNNIDNNDNDDENVRTEESSECNFSDSSMSALRSGNSATRGTSALERRNQLFQLQRELEFSNWMNYELVIMLDSSDYASTFHKLQIAKHKGVIVGHSELDVLPVELAAPHVYHAANLFYDGSKSTCNIKHGNLSEGNDMSANSDCSGGDNNNEEISGGQKCINTWGKFRQIGDSVTINTKVSSDSFYQDPTNAYTEPHAVFTEYLKLHRGQRENNGNNEADY